MARRCTPRRPGSQSSFQPRSTSIWTSGRKQHGVCQVSTAETAAAAAAPQNACLAAIWIAFGLLVEPPLTLAFASLLALCTSILAEMSTHNLAEVADYLGVQLEDAPTVSVETCRNIAAVFSRMLTTYGTTTQCAWPAGVPRTSCSLHRSGAGGFVLLQGPQPCWLRATVYSAPRSLGACCEPTKILLRDQAMLTLFRRGCRQLSRVAVGTRCAVQRRRSGRCRRVGSSRRARTW